jgi:hypothetical protein
MIGQRGANSAGSYPSPPPVTTVASEKAPRATEYRGVLLRMAQRQFSKPGFGRRHSSPDGLVTARPRCGQSGLPRHKTHHGSSPSAFRRSARRRSLSISCGLLAVLVTVGLVAADAFASLMRRSFSICQGDFCWRGSQLDQAKR